MKRSLSHSKLLKIGRISLIAILFLFYFVGCTKWHIKGPTPFIALTETAPAGDKSGLGEAVDKVKQLKSSEGGIEWMDLRLKHFSEEGTPVLIENKTKLTFTRVQSVQFYYGTGGKVSWKATPNKCHLSIPICPPKSNCAVKIEKGEWIAGLSAPRGFGLTGTTAGCPIGPFTMLVDERPFKVKIKGNKFAMTVIGGIFTGIGGTLGLVGGGAMLIDKKADSAMIGLATGGSIMMIVGIILLATSGRNEIHVEEMDDLKDWNAAAGVTAKALDGKVEEEKLSAHGEVGPTTGEPSVPSFGPFTFAAGITDDGQPINPATTFPAGTNEVYAIFDYSGMEGITEYTSTWYYNGKLDFTNTLEWNAGDSGTRWLRLYNDNGLASGTYKLELSVGGKILQSGTKVINRSRQ